MAREKQKEFADIPLQDFKEEFISVAAMQRHIMPDPEWAPVFGDFDIVGKTLPINTPPLVVIGGDFHTFIDLEHRFGIKGKMGIVIADAAGHGLAAAMLIRDFNTALHMAISFQSYYVQDTTPLIFTKVNRRLYRSSQTNQFISSFYSELHLDGTLRYMNAGHPSPRLFKRDAVVALTVGGPVLGAFPDPPHEYQVGEAVMEPGDVLVGCTDGIVETHDGSGREYGFERLEKVVRESRHKDARGIFDAILRDVEGFGSGRGQEDDRTLIVIRRAERD